MTFDYDLFVIGGGSGGVRAARVAAGEAGAKVGLAEESRYGGTCVIRGCVPKKLMVFASEYAPAMEDARAYGWDVEARGFDWQMFHGKLAAELDRLEGIYRRLLANINQKGCFLGGQPFFGDKIMDPERGDLFVMYMVIRHHAADVVKTTGLAVNSPIGRGILCLADEHPALVTDILADDNFGWRLQISRLPTAGEAGQNEQAG